MKPGEFSGYDREWTQGTASLPAAWRGLSPAMLNICHLGCAGGENSAHLEQISTLPRAWFLGYKAGE
jgi:hypothetical protein